MKKIAFYLRLSKEDENGKQSESVKGQRELLYNFIDCNDEFKNQPISEFCDDGFSGTNFNRPAMKELLNDIKAGHINCVLVKDLSRIGRNYLEVGKFLEHTIKTFNVRLISINNNYDSDKLNTNDCVEIPLQNLVYDFYSKDISNKIKSGKLAKINKGQYISAYAPYGFLKEHTNKNNLVVDNVASKNIVKIFDSIIDGYTTTMVAKLLNDEGILTPKSYRDNIHLQKGKSCKSNLWTRESILRIIKDERYMGNFVGRKSERAKVGTNRINKIKQSEWIRITNVFPSIVNEEIFTQANDKIKKKVIGKRYVKENFPLKKRVYCINCDNTLKRKKGAYTYFFCGNNKISDKICGSHKLYESSLEGNLILIINIFIKLLYSTNNIKENMLKNYYKVVNATTDQIKIQDDQIHIIENEKFKIYNEYIKNNMGKEDFIKMKNDNDIKVSNLKGSITKSYRYIRGVEEKIKNINTCNDFSMDILSYEIVNSLIDSIKVDENNNLEITFTFNSIF